jgi:hypothetical protein
MHFCVFQSFSSLSCVFGRSLPVPFIVSPSSLPTLVVHLPAAAMYHFINCMVLTFAPHVICYKATKLSAMDISLSRHATLQAGEVVPLTGLPAGLVCVVVVPRRAV